MSESSEMYQNMNITMGERDPRRSKPAELICRSIKC